MLKNHFLLYLKSDQITNQNINIYLVIKKYMQVNIWK